MRSICIALALVLAAALPALAQSPELGSGMAFKKADTNSDGKVDRQEYTDFVAKGFDRLDKDGDGFITEPEVQEARGNRQELRQKLRDMRDSKSQ